MKHYIRTGLLILAVITWSSVAAGDAPLSSTGVTRWSATTGFIDPTVPTFNGSAPMRCTASTTPSSAFTEQNRLAFQAALNLAGSTRQWIYMPPCQVDVLAGNAICTTTSGCGYPVSKKAGSTCGVDMSGLSNINLVGYGAVIRQAANPAGSAEFDLVCIRGTSHVKIIGMHWSQRDVAGSTSEQIHILEIGTGTLVADDVLIYHNKFIEPVPKGGGNRGGDCIRILGTSEPSTNTRINIIENTMFCRRSSLGIQRGFQYVNFVGNFTYGVTDQDIDYEPSSEGKIHNLLANDNIFDRRGSPNATAVTFSGTSGTSLAVGTTIADNVFIEGSVTASGNVSQVWVRNNIISSGISRADSNSNVEAFRRAADVWITNNQIYRGAQALVTASISVRHQIDNCAGGGPNCHPETIWINGNRIELHSLSTTGSTDASAGIGIDSVRDVWANENIITYHGAGADSGLNGPVGINFQSTGDNVASGWMIGNDIRSTVQDDGVTAAGRMLAGIVFNSSTFPVSFAYVRDNMVARTRMLLFSNAATPALLPNGPPLLSGNTVALIGSSTGEVIGNGAFTSETAIGVDRLIGGGSLSPSTRTSVLTNTCASSSYTLPVCEVDGLIKRVNLVGAACASSDTMTISGFGDGSGLSWTLAANSAGSFRLACDASAGAWWLLDRTAGITVTP